MSSKGLKSLRDFDVQTTKWQPDEPSLDSGRDTDRGSRGQRVCGVRASDRTFYRVGHVRGQNTVLLFFVFFVGWLSVAVKMPNTPEARPALFSLYY